MRADAAELGRLRAHDLDGLLGGRGLLGDPRRERDDRDQDRRGDEDHDDAEDDPHRPAGGGRHHR